MKLQKRAMITSFKNGRYMLLVGLTILIALWTYFQLETLCLLDQCHEHLSKTPNSSDSNAGSSLGQGVGGIDNTQPFSLFPRPPPADNNSPNSIIDLSKPNAPFIAWPLFRVCTKTNRMPSSQRLIFICDNNSGGIGNIRNFILTCLRYAIEAGASGIVLPTIQTRNQERLGDLFRGEKMAFSHFFDEKHFREGLKAACPSLVVYDDLNSVEGINAGRWDKEEDGAARNWPEIIQVTPNHLGMRGGCDARDLNRHTDLFGARFRKWMADQPDLKYPTTTKLIRFNWGVQWDWPVYRDGPEFTATFGGILRFRSDILDLGKQIVAVIERKQLAKGEKGFLGVHLRTENDALSTWPSFDEQARTYLARASSFRLAYVATGNETDASRFAALASTQGLQSITKHQLLTNESERELVSRLEDLSWDQQALVDFVVLLYANLFLGVSPSSFSMNVALKRHLQKEGLYTRPWKVGSEDGDGRSWLVGRYDNYWEDWLFMYDSLWP